VIFVLYFCKFQENITICYNNKVSVNGIVNYYLLTNKLNVIG